MPILRDHPSAPVLEVVYTHFEDNGGNREEIESHAPFLLGKRKKRDAYNGYWEVARSKLRRIFLLAYVAERTMNKAQGGELEHLIIP